MSSSTDVVSPSNSSEQILLIILDHPKAREAFKSFCTRTQNDDQFNFLICFRHEYTAALQRRCTHTELIGIVEKIAANFLLDGAPQELNLERSVRTAVAAEINNFVAAVQTEDTVPINDLDSYMHCRVHKSLRDINLRIELQVGLDCLPRFLRDAAWTVALAKEDVAGQVRELRRKQAIDRVKITPEAYRSLDITLAQHELFDHMSEDADFWDLVQASEVGSVYVSKGQQFTSGVKLAAFKHVCFFDLPLWIVWAAAVSLETVYRTSNGGHLASHCSENLKRGSTNPDDTSKTVGPFTLTVISDISSVSRFLSKRKNVWVGAHRWQPKHNRLAVTVKSVLQDYSAHATKVMSEVKHKSAKRAVRDTMSTVSIQFQRFGSRTRFCMCYLMNLGGMLKNVSVNLRPVIVQKAALFEEIVSSVAKQIQTDPIGYFKRDPSLWHSTSALMDNIAAVGASFSEDDEQMGELVRIYKQLMAEQPTPPTPVLGQKQLREMYGKP